MEDCDENLMNKYGTIDEHEVAILMPVPALADQMQLIRAFDLNPLI